MFTMKPIEKEDIKFKTHKRILYTGIRRESGPILTEFLYTGSLETIENNIRHVNLFPVILVWETEKGDRKYGTIEKIK